jgi:hypothetical protein
VAVRSLELAASENGLRFSPPFSVIKIDIRQVS